MSGKQYVINKGMNRALELKGLKAQYIGHLVGAVVGVLVVFAIMYIAGVSSYICVPSALGLGGLAIARVFRMSKRYGQYGLMKRRARKSAPSALVSKSRKLFIQLYRDHVGHLR